MLGKLYYFFGSIYFAIIILISLVLFIILGTFIESSTGSHLYASKFTYNHFFFLAILFSAFINILLSALRRWPFKIRHIPFLITHFGLLMIISGVVIKNIYGIQGNMIIREGMSNDKVIIPQTFAIKIENKLGNNKIFELNQTLKDLPIFSIPEENISIQVLQYAPHAFQKINSWIKDGFCFICGLDPIKVYENIEDIENLPMSSKIKMFHDHSEIWDIYALKTNEPLTILKKLYLKDARVKLRSFSSIFKTSLKKALNEGLKIKNSIYTLEINLEKTHLKFFNDKKTFTFKFSSNDIFNNKPWEINHGTFEIEQSPKLIFLQDENNLSIYAIDRYGHLYTKQISDEDKGQIISYDEGYGGYYSLLEIPFFSGDYGAKNILKARIYELQRILQKAIEEKNILALPIQFIQKISNNASQDFIEVFIKLLLKEKIPKKFYANIDWNFIPKSDFKAAYWSYFLKYQNKEKFKKNIRNEIFSIANHLPDVPVKIFNTKINQYILDEYLKHYELDDKKLILFPLSPDEIKDSLMQYSEANQIFQRILKDFPFINSLTKKQTIEAISKLSEELFPIEINEQTLNKKSFLSLLERLPMKKNEKNLGKNFIQGISLESPLFSQIINMPLNLHIEKNTPSLTLKLSQGNKSEIIKLIYDPLGKGWKWPALQGKYLLSFQPMFHQLPFKIKLHEAREIKYSHSNQPFSYESDIYIYENKNKIPYTLSMNHVYESNSGYRFYLSHIATLANGIKRIQLAVNYDPLKMWLTYPGGIFVTIGIISLFGMKLKKNKLLS